MKNVNEQVYGTSSCEDHNIFVNGIGVLPDELIEKTIATRFKKKNPNSYTLSKHFAEQIVLDYYDRLPVCIVRPSIVTAAVNEPFPGWIDNMYGITGSCQ
jgi:fatty acyl-CoA reductase